MCSRSRSEQQVQPFAWISRFIINWRAMLGSGRCRRWSYVFWWHTWQRGFHTFITPKTPLSAALMLEHRKHSQIVINTVIARVWRWELRMAPVRTIGIWGNFHGIQKIGRFLLGYRFRVWWQHHRSYVLPLNFLVEGQHRGFGLIWGLGRLKKSKEWTWIPFKRIGHGSWDYLNSLQQRQKHRLHGNSPTRM